MMGGFAGHQLTTVNGVGTGIVVALLAGSNGRGRTPGGGFSNPQVTAGAARTFMN
jgi:hypothetical protein